MPDVRDKIFISYRRKDAPGYAALIQSRLSGEFGNERVFQDIRIPPGVYWRQQIDLELENCAVVVAVIGRQWASDPRLRDPIDLLRRELAVGLQKGIPVIPVLVDGAALPNAEKLPDDLKSLLERQALIIPEDDFGRGLDRLVARLKDLLLRRTSIKILIGLVLAVVGGLVNFGLGAVWPTALGAAVLLVAVWLAIDQVLLAHGWDPTHRH